MSAQIFARQIESYKLLRNLLHQFRATLDPHLDEVTLSERGVDASTFDLEHDSNEYTYFLPITASRVKALDKRPELDVNFFFPRTPGSCIADADKVQVGIHRQLFGFDEDEDDNFQAILFSPWRMRCKTSYYERELEEFDYPGKIPTQQHRWYLNYVLEAEGHPHQLSVACHAIPNVTGLLRSEMMILTSLMMAKMRRTLNNLQETYPVLLLSIIGRNARIIQAHVCPVRQRLIVRYSQLFNYEYFTQDTMDLFVGWMLSTPIYNKVLDTETLKDDTSSEDWDTLRR